MSKTNDKLDRSRMDVRRRQRIVKVGGVGPMTQERVKCPFCSELILRDAIKCRFCGEWFSEPDQEMESGGSVEDSDLEDFGRERYPLVVRNTQSHFGSSQAGQQRDSQPPPRADDDHGEEQVEGVEATEESPPVRIAKEVIPAEKAGLRSVRVGTGIPWLRALLLIFYLGIIAALVVTEFGARGILGDARVKEDAKEYDAAFEMYRTVQDTYLFSFAAVEARENLVRLGQSQGFELPKAAWHTAAEDLLGIKVNVRDVHILPLAAWPISALVLFLVFLTRIRRVGAALVALLLMILAVSGSIAQLAWYDLIPLASAAEAIDQFMQAPEIVYVTSYALLILTASMTLTATTPRIDLQIAKMAVATARKR